MMDTPDYTPNRRDYLVGAWRTAKAIAALAALWLTGMLIYHLGGLITFLTLVGAGLLGMSVWYHASMKAIERVSEARENA